MAYYIKALIGPYDTAEEAENATEILRMHLIKDEFEFLFNEQPGYPPYEKEIKSIEVIEWACS